MKTNEQDRWSRTTGMDNAFNAMMIVAAMVVIAHAIVTATMQETNAPQQIAATPAQTA